MKANGKNLRNEEDLINELISACNSGPEDWSDIHDIYDEIKASGNPELIKKAEYVMKHV